MGFKNNGAHEKELKNLHESIIGGQSLSPLETKGLLNLLTKGKTGEEYKYAVFDDFKNGYIVHVVKQPEDYYVLTAYGMRRGALKNKAEVFGFDPDGSCNSLWVSHSTLHKTGDVMNFKKEFGKNGEDLDTFISLDSSESRFQDSTSEEKIEALRKSQSLLKGLLNNKQNRLTSVPLYLVSTILEKQVHRK